MNDGFQNMEDMSFMVNGAMYRSGGLKSIDEDRGDLEIKKNIFWSLLGDIAFWVLELDKEV